MNLRVAKKILRRSLYRGYTQQHLLRASARWYAQPWHQCGLW